MDKTMWWVVAGAVLLVVYGASTQTSAGQAGTTIQNTFTPVGPTALGALTGAGNNGTSTDLGSTLIQAPTSWSSAGNATPTPALPSTIAAPVSWAGDTDTISSFGLAQ